MEMETLAFAGPGPAEVLVILFVACIVLVLTAVKVFRTYPKT